MTDSIAWVWWFFVGAGLLLGAQGIYVLRAKQVPRRIARKRGQIPAHWFAGQLLLGALFFFMLGLPPLLGWPAPVLFTSMLFSFAPLLGSMVLASKKVSVD
ncbi:hypothetical protein [Microtetraspora sp. NBRC 16547]|uniref:hypothetical protein n=1 Tax=Microtetraspora sp. NBRC 16547 TaxID=3030993 RepID=UPI0024A0B45B|nr:hypothetical protein [Microtetraspora sp. NBRC 16547]GLW96978.1 hypothetical protein Misp02_10650 [Microtetraspora sp. NBRC 16547]